MINLKDLYTYSVSIPLGTVGVSIISYEIRRYRDVRNLGNTLAYQVLCTQRVVIPNSPWVPSSTNTFDKYPAIIKNNIIVTSTGNSIELINYTPRTINSAVSTSVSSGSGTNASASQQHTSGSSTSQSNSFGVSASLGMNGMVPTVSVTADYDHSWGSDRSKSTSSGSDTGSSSQNSSGESMSVKDWACYTQLDSGNSSPTWVWGQEYPWNVIQFHNSGGTIGNNVTLPSFIVPLLCDGTQAFPPSQLSLFGVDFTMKCVWLVELATSCTTISANHNIDYYMGKHFWTAPSSSGSLGTVTASIYTATSFPFTIPSSTTSSIDLCTYGLDPILGTSQKSGAIIGFVPSKFIIPPAPPTHFRIISSGNNLMISDTTQHSNTAGSGAGFTASETALTATFAQNCNSLQMTVSFKIIDEVNEYILFMKHWIGNASGDIMLQMVINGDTQSTITKYVTAKEAEGGENNLLSIALRNQDYASVDYHDFLQLGLNSIQITISPVAGNVNAVYHIRAISIERN